MGSDDSAEPVVPAWAEAERRRVVSRPGGQPPVSARWLTSGPTAPTSTHDWLDEPWDDVALRRPGQGLIEESRERRARDESGWSWDVGAEGEYILAEALKELTEPRVLGRLWRSRRPASWFVLHGPKIGAAAIADVDHVLIGPPGVVVINAKKLSSKYRVTVRDGEVFVGTFRHDFLKKVRADAERASWLLTSAAKAVVARRRSGDLPAGWELSGLWGAVEEVAFGGMLSVIPALGFVGSGALDERMGPTVVARSTTICRMLRDRPPVLDEARVRTLYEIARRSTTWTRDAPH